MSTTPTAPPICVTVDKLDGYLLYKNHENPLTRFGEIEKDEEL